MAQASGKRMDNWKRLESTTEFLVELEGITGYPLMVSNVGGTPETTGSWAVEEVAIEFAGWCSVQFKVWCIQQIKTLMTEGTVSIRENLERQFQPDRSIRELDHYTEWMGRVYGVPYKQRLVPIVVKKYYPDLPILPPTVEEKVSLPTEALLTPTQLAQELGIFYKTGNPNPRKVNDLLKGLGYQTQIGGQWSATERAKGLCDRKPVDTNSKTQRDQLLWNINILEVLKEFVC